jgi:hypothetical protein
MSIKTYFGTVLFFLLSGAAILGGSIPKFDYLDVKDNTVTTTHQARYKIEIDKSFKFLGELNHQPVYEGKQFNVSLAAFAKGETIIFVHAETHTDNSGGLDYSKLKAASLNNLKFTSREQCAPVEAVEDLADNEEVIFLREKKYAIMLPFYMKQYLATSADGKAEIVISYGTRVPACGKNTPEFDEQIAQEIRENIKVGKIK